MIGSRRFLVLILLAGLVAGAGGATGQTVERLTITFTHSPIGEPPPEFTFAASRQATPGLWNVAGNATSRHLVHTGDPAVTMRGISVAPLSAPAPANVRVTSRLRLIDGDLAAGVVWRYRNVDNFYFLALVLSSQSLSVFRVTDGNRVLLAVIRGLELDPRGWHAVTAVHAGDQIRGIIDGVTVLRARDNVITGGYAGIWSAGNSTNWFESVIVEDVPN